MRKRKIYDDKLQIDYFSDSYLKFEEDFYRYSAMDIPLTFLTDDITIFQSFPRYLYCLTSVLESTRLTSKWK